MSIISLAKHSIEKLNIYIITAKTEYRDKTFMPIRECDISSISDYLKTQNPLNSIQLIDITNKFNAAPAKANLGTRFTPMCMLRLYADTIEMIPDKILYLDCDVICKKDFSIFYNRDINDYELCGVLDRYGKWFFKKNPFKFDYINSGVLLLNMKKIRETKLFEKCRHKCATKKMFMPDQSAINKKCKYKFIVDNKYNEQNKDRQDTVFRHFTTRLKFFPYFKSVTVKPWNLEKMHSVLKSFEYDELYFTSLKI